MKIGSTHKNLNTSYVNLSALLKYLRRHKFVGRVRFESKGYEADIFFSKKKGIEARENDHISGRIAVGDDVLPRIFVRAHEADGIINIFDKADEKKSVNVAAADESLGTDFTEVAENIPIQKPIGRDVLDNHLNEQKPISLKEKLGLPSLPFSFGKSREQKSLSIESHSLPEVVELEPENDPLQDWHELLGLIGEILRSVDESLAKSNLNFVWVFEKVRAEVFENYPFLHPNSTVFEYQNGVVSMKEQINNNLFVASIAECLERLIGKLQTHPKYNEVRTSVIWNILELMNKNHKLYDKFFITQQLERVVES